MWRVCKACFLLWVTTAAEHQAWYDPFMEKLFSFSSHKFSYYWVEMFSCIVSLKSKLLALTAKTFMCIIILGYIPLILISGTFSPGTFLGFLQRYFKVSHLRCSPNTRLGDVLFQNCFFVWISKTFGNFYILLPCLSIFSIAIYFLRAIF